jgi:hypothetical protein
MFQNSKNQFNSIQYFFFAILNTSKNMEFFNQIQLVRRRRRSSSSSSSSSFSPYM